MAKITIILQDDPIEGGAHVFVDLETPLPDDPNDYSQAEQALGDVMAALTDDADPDEGPAN